ncbi:probable Xaa-Pro aminopeptidase 3 isoform X2 [Orussus abietinus]|uniref:probable Xaa-Pro aminopeptidase 3 isoform X2 n=1 Tax=Orussus abietinus TaxID=222816 RepID=UPI0006258D39|nr:probable Xaa-Pro aminopeptidase 3 isoform X2 [Orussus abietinus]
MFCSMRFVTRNLPIFGYQTFAKCSTEITQGLVSHQQRIQNFSESTYGQPTPKSHSHLLKEGELIPGFKLEEFKNRRNKLMEMIISGNNIGKNSKQSQILIIPSSTKVYMSDKIPYVFRQNTDFLYFTGCQEPDSALVMFANNDQFKSVLFMRKKDEHSELWDGPRTGVEAAAEMFGVDEALPTTEFELYLVSLLSKHRNCGMWYDSTEIVQPELHKKLQELRNTSIKTFESPKTIIHRIRLIKSESEIQIIQKSCEVASAAIAKTIQMSKPGMRGKNANIIHYIMNNQIIQNGDMVLMDAGCEYHGYTSDITRTWPINGTFTPQQVILYDIVLDVQKALIERLHNMPTLDQIFHEMCFLLGKRLQEIGLIPNNLSQEKLISAAYSYCPHHVSHYLGMDVHDTGTISRNIHIEPGMIVTMEPGIYVNSKNKLAPVEFHGLGIRIEDDILLRSDGPIVLTKNCPKEIQDIEQLVKQNQC